MSALCPFCALGLNHDASLRKLEAAGQLLPRWLRQVAPTIPSTDRACSVDALCHLQAECQSLAEDLMRAQNTSAFCTRRLDMRTYQLCPFCALDIDHDVQAADLAKAVKRLHLQIHPDKINQSKNLQRLAEADFPMVRLPQFAQECAGLAAALLQAGQSRALCSYGAAAPAPAASAASASGEHMTAREPLDAAQRFKNPDCPRAPHCPPLRGKTDKKVMEYLFLYAAAERCLPCMRFQISQNGVDPWCRSCNKNARAWASGSARPLPQDIDAFLREWGL